MACHRLGPRISTLFRIYSFQGVESDTSQKPSKQISWLITSLSWGLVLKMSRIVKCRSFLNLKTKYSSKKQTRQVTLLTVTPYFSAIPWRVSVLDMACLIYCSGLLWWLFVLPYFLRDLADSLIDSFSSIINHKQINFTA